MRRVPSITDESAIGDRNATSGGSNRMKSLYKHAEGHQHGHAHNSPQVCSQNTHWTLHGVHKYHPWHQTQNVLTQYHQGVAHYIPTVWSARLCESCGRELRLARDADIATDTFHVMWHDGKVAVGLMWEFKIRFSLWRGPL